MGFFDNLKEALGAERDEHADAAEPISTPAATPANSVGTGPRHVDRNAPEESVYGPQTTGGKHALRD